MTAPKVYLDQSPGERRGVVFLDGRPERLLIERDDDAPAPRAGEVWRGRVRTVSRGFRAAFVDLGQERDGLLGLSGAEPALADGASVEVEVIAEARLDKGPAVKFLRTGSGPPERVAPAPPLEARLAALARGQVVATGAEALEAADLAEEAALATCHDIGSGVTLTIEKTRALVAVDVDVGEARVNRHGLLNANLAAIRQTARLVRLKRLGGVIVIDLAGAAREHAPLLDAARTAFSEAGSIVAGVSRLGVLEIARPWREQPITEILCDRDGRLSARSHAQRLVRAMQREGAASPGARIVCTCAPDVAAVLDLLARDLGPRFSVAAELGRERASADIRAL